MGVESLVSSGMTMAGDDMGNRDVLPGGDVDDDTKAIFVMTRGGVTSAISHDTVISDGTPAISDDGTMKWHRNQQCHRNKQCHRSQR